MHVGQCWVTGRGPARKQGPRGILLPRLYFCCCIVKGNRDALYARHLCGREDTQSHLGNWLSTTEVGNFNTLINGIPKKHTICIILVLGVMRCAETLTRAAGCGGQEG